MRCRAFMILIRGAAAAWPLAARSSRCCPQSGSSNGDACRFDANERRRTFIASTISRSSNPCAPFQHPNRCDTMRCVVL